MDELKKGGKRWVYWRLRAEILNAVKSVQDLKAIEFVLNEYHETNSKFPTSLEELIMESKLSLSIRDPWGNPYYYQLIDNKAYTLLGFGSNGSHGGVGSAADLMSTTEHNEIEGSIKGWFSCN